jgi:hypothetical protein
MLLVPDDLFGGPVIFVSPPSPHAQAAVPGGVLCPEWPRDQRAGLVLRAHLPRLFLVLSKNVFYNDFVLFCKLRRIMRDPALRRHAQSRSYQLKPRVVNAKKVY